MQTPPRREPAKVPGIRWLKPHAPPMSKRCRKCGQLVAIEKHARHEAVCDWFGHAR
jgi:hypothetical protein